MHLWYPKAWQHTIYSTLISIVMLGKELGNLYPPNTTHIQQHDHISKNNKLLRIFRLEQKMMGTFRFMTRQRRRRYRPIHMTHCGDLHKMKIMKPKAGKNSVLNRQENPKTKGKDCHPVCVCVCVDEESKNTKTTFTSSFLWMLAMSRT
jgi:hypothetical protein